MKYRSNSLLLIVLFFTQSFSFHPSRCTDVTIYEEEVPSSKVRCYNSIQNIRQDIQDLDFWAVNYLENPEAKPKVTDQFFKFLREVTAVEATCEIHIKPYTNATGDFDSNYCRENVFSMLTITSEVSPEPNLRQGIQNVIEFVEFAESASRACGWDQ